MNGEDWGKLIVAKGFKKLPKIQNIAQSGHTTYRDPCHESEKLLQSPFVMLLNIFFKKWANPALFCLFSFFSGTNFTEKHFLCDASGQFLLEILKTFLDWYFISR